MSRAAYLATIAIAAVIGIQVPKDPDPLAGKTTEGPKIEYESRFTKNTRRYRIRNPDKEPTAEVRWEYKRETLLYVARLKSQQWVEGSTTPDTLPKTDKTVFGYGLNADTFSASPEAFVPNLKEKGFGLGNYLRCQIVGTITDREGGDHPIDVTVSSVIGLDTSFGDGANIPLIMYRIESYGDEQIQVANDMPSPGLNLSWESPEEGSIERGLARHRAINRDYVATAQVRYKSFEEVRVSSKLLKIRHANELLASLQAPAFRK
jgi:hypothetical protein